MYVDSLNGTNVCRFEDRVWRLVHFHEGNLIQQGSSSNYSEVRFQIMRDNAWFGNWESGDGNWKQLCIEMNLQP